MGKADRQREELREQRLAAETQDASAEARRRRTVQLASLGVFGAVILVAILIVVSQSGGGSSTTTVGSAGNASGLKGIAQADAEISGLPQSGTVLGQPNAPVTIVEYGDLQCPICQEFSQQEEPALIAKYVKSGQAKYDFKIWPIIGPQSAPAGEAALAAGEQGRYWNFIGAFYKNQGEENSGYVTDAFLTSVAKAAGVSNLSKWNTDRKNPSFADALKTNNAEAGKLGFTGTPSILVQGPKGQKPFQGSTVPTLGQIESAISSVQ